MCGFAGFLFTGAPAQDAGARRQQLQAMGDAIAHRGPDDAQYYDDGRLALVFRRLSIVDVQGGAQPMRSEASGLLAVVNGEIYNHVGLRSQLQARHAFRSRSDCEVALHAWAEWGERSLDRLHGMFALLMWDRAAGRLSLARDRLGIKPLYVCELPHGLLFGSELKALLAHPECPRRLDWRAVDRAMICQPPGTSYVHGVRQLAGGELLQVQSDGRSHSRRWWDLADHLGRAPLGQDDARAYSDHYAELLQQVTREHLQRDVGAALALSGGLDSSLLAAIVARVEPQFPCFTIVEHGSVTGGDAQAARSLTAQLGLPWYAVAYDHRALVGDLRFGLDRFEEAVWMMDSPRFDLEWVFKSELQRTAREHVPGLKVLLIGQGADEFAGGYSHRADAPRPDWASYLREEVEPNLVLQHTTDQGGGNLLWYLAPAPSVHASYHRMMLQLTRQLQHHNLWHEDRTSSWNSLEARVPFLDHRLVEFLAGVPQALHERLFWRKQIVRDAFARFAPGVQLSQPKIGFLHSGSERSLDSVCREMANAIYPSFRRRHLEGRTTPFDASRLDALAAAVRARGPGWAQQARQLLDCMAVAVFQSQCEGARPAARRRHAPVLPVIEPEHWESTARSLAQEPVVRGRWRMEDGVRLAEGVRVLTPLQAGERKAYTVVAGGDVVGGFESSGAGTAWLDTFLRHLGTPATQGFTVADWIDEFELDARVFVQTLDVLATRGVVALPELEQTSAPPDLWLAATTPAPLQELPGTRHAA